MQTTLEALETRVESRMMDAIERLTREIHERIDNFKIWMEERFYEARIPNL